MEGSLFYSDGLGVDVGCSVQVDNGDLEIFVFPAARVVVFSCLRGK